ncbi:MAG TPA: hypothetical protein VE735_00490 [Gammaproteobacteria bacterium]|jgi:hypothetical protein|nr:hypothetical protein [Gammaproteobacteria bacterium]
MRFLRAIRFERMWSLLGLALSIAYSNAQKERFFDSSRGDPNML